MKTPLALLAAILVPAAALAQDAGEPGLVGEWELTLVRDGMWPKVSPGVLRLAEGEEGWTGQLGFERILHAKPWALESIEVEDTWLQFELRGAGCVLEFEGELADGKLAGPCNWLGLGEYEWSAKRAEPAAFFDAEPLEKDPFPRAAPGDVGVDPAALEALVRKARRSGSDALFVLVDGKLVSERTFHGARRPIEAMSATKSIVGLAFGLLIDAGAIEGIDVPVHTWFPEWADGPRAGITLRHLLTHTSGLGANRTTEAIYASDDFVLFALEAQPVADPGTAFFYNNRAVNLLAGIVEVAGGAPLDEYLGERLFAPLGITDFGWTRDSAGNPHAMSGLQIRALDLARIGQLLLDGGVWQGKRLLPADWIADSLVATPVGAGKVDHGLLWWLTPPAAGKEREEPAPRVWTVPGSSPKRAQAMRPLEAFWAQGYLGQYLVVVPATRVVAVRMRAAHDRGEDFGAFERMVRELVPR